MRNNAIKPSVGKMHFYKKIQAPDHITISFLISYQQIKRTTNTPISNFTSFFVDLRRENLPKVKQGRSSFSNGSYFRKVVTYKSKKPCILRGSETRTRIDFVYKIRLRASIVGLLAKLVERYTGIAEVMGSNPVRT